MISYCLKIQNINSRLLAVVSLVPVTLVWLLISNFNNWEQKAKSYQCHPKAILTANNTTQTLKGNLKNNETTCFQFPASSGQILSLNTNTKITLLTPINSVFSLQGSSKILLQPTGNYSIHIISNQEDINYQIDVKRIYQNLANKPGFKPIESQSHSSQYSTVGSQLSYNVVKPPPFEPNSKLQNIVDGIINVVQSRGLPTERLSVSLVDLSSSKCCAYAYYSDQEPRFPASIVKLFWMVALYGQYQAREIPEGTVAKKELSKMIQDSSNESASRILDKVTKTTSGKNLSKNELNKWSQQRYSVNHFFEEAGFAKLNISQKTFPIPYLKLEEPKGRDMQIRKNVAKPDRNYLTTYNVARLLFEIHTEQSISKDYSKKMKSLLKRDLRPEAWKQKPYNSISGFLGESLPVDTDFASKMGWTFSNRNDAAIVVSPDKKAQYILVIFGDAPSFYEDKKLFPEISRMVYEKMTTLNSS